MCMVFKTIIYGSLLLQLVSFLMEKIILKMMWYTIQLKDDAHIMWITWASQVMVDVHDCICSTLNPLVILEKSLLSDLMDWRASRVEIGFTWLVPSKPFLLASRARRWLTLELIFEHSSLLSWILLSFSVS